jgi:hypothetical protein
VRCPHSNDPLLTTQLFLRTWRYLSLSSLTFGGMENFLALALFSLSK